VTPKRALVAGEPGGDAAGERGGVSAESEAFRFLSDGLDGDELIAESTKSKNGY
jgi:hypothetical protein